MKKDKDFGKPNLIYLGKVVLDKQEKPVLQFKNCKNYNSVVENNTGQNMENLQLINNTNINNLNKNNTEKSQSVELDKIKEQCKLDILVEEDEFGNINARKKSLVENAIEIMFYSQDLKVDNAVIPQELIRKKMLQLNGAIICYALDKLNTNLINTQNITNSTKYLVSCIYNAITEYYSDAELQYKIDCLN